jgi:hypothetical protein
MPVPTIYISGGVWTPTPTPLLYTPLPAGYAWPARKWNEFVSHYYLLSCFEIRFWQDTITTGKPSLTQPPDYTWYGGGVGQSIGLGATEHVLISLLLIRDDTTARCDFLFNTARVIYYYCYYRKTIIKTCLHAYDSTFWMAVAAAHFENRLLHFFYFVFYSTGGKTFCALFGK